MRLRKGSGVVLQLCTALILSILLRASGLKELSTSNSAHLARRYAALGQTEGIHQTAKHARVLLQAESPEVVADTLPPGPDPSQFTFSQSVLEEIPDGEVTLTLQLLLFGGDLLPFNDELQEAVTSSFQNILDSSIGQNSYTLGAPEVLQTEEGSSANANLDSVKLAIGITSSAANIQLLSSPLESQIQNAQLAGVMRQQGLYNLQRLSVDSYTVEAQAPGEAPGIDASAESPGTSDGLPSLTSPVPSPQEPGLPLVEPPAPAPTSPPLVEPPAPAPSSPPLVEAPAPALISLPLVEAPAPTTTVADSPAPSPSTLTLQSPTQAELQAPEPAATPLVTPALASLPPLPSREVGDAPAPGLGESTPVEAPEGEAPGLAIGGFILPINRRAPGPQPGLPAPVPSPDSGPPAPAPSPDLSPPALSPGGGAPAPEPSPLLLVLPDLVPPAPVPAPMEAPAPQPVFTAPRPSPAVAPVEAPAPVPAPAPQAVYSAPTPSPAEAPAPAPQQFIPLLPVASPEVSVPAPSPMLESPAPEPSPAQAPEAESPAPSPTVLPLAVPAPRPAMDESALGVPAPGPPVAEANVPSRSATIVSPLVLAPQQELSTGVVPSPSPSSDVSFQVKLTGVSNLNQTGMSVLQSALATVLGQDVNAVNVGGGSSSSMAAAGRRFLLQATTTVPVTISSDDSSQLNQQLETVGSNTTDLQNALNAAGLPVTETEILNSDGQPISSPSVPAPQGRSFNKGAVYGGVIGGVVGGAILALLAACGYSRFNAYMKSNRYPPSDSQALGGSYTPPASKQMESSFPKASPMGSRSSNRTRQSGGPSGAMEGFHQIPPRRGDSPLERFDSEKSWQSAEGINVSESTASRAREAPYLQSQPSWKSAEGIPSPYAGSKPPTNFGSSSFKIPYQQSPTAQTPHVVPSARLLPSSLLVAGKYTFSEDCIQGEHTLVTLATGPDGKQCLCKILLTEDEAAHRNETALQQAIFALPLPVPELLEIIPAGVIQPDLPKCFVYSTGDWVLSQWLDSPEEPSTNLKKTIIYSIARSLARIHGKSFVHGNLTPDNIYYSTENRNIKLASFSLWAKNGEPIPLHQAIRYLSPEAAAANAAGQRMMLASPHLDSWALGIIMLEMFGRQQGPPVLDTQQIDTQLQELTGAKALPWESQPNYFDCVSEPDAQAVIPYMLKRNPAERWSVDQLLKSRLFSEVSMDPGRSLDYERPSAEIHDSASAMPFLESRESRIVEVPRETGVAEVPRSTAEEHRTHTSTSVTEVTEKVEYEDPDPSPSRPSDLSAILASVPLQSGRDTSASREVIPLLSPADSSGHSQTEFQPVREQLEPRSVDIEYESETEDETRPLHSKSAEDEQAGPSQPRRTITLSGGDLSVASSSEDQADPHDKQEVKPFVLHRIPYTILPTLRGASVLSMSVSMERVTSNTGALTGPQILRAVMDGTLQTAEVPKVTSRASSPENPVFLMHQGATFLLRLRLAAGSERGWVPLMLSGPDQINISVARKNTNQLLEFLEINKDVSKWEGYAVWDTSRPQTARLAGKHGQLTRIYLTLDCFCQDSDNVVTVEDNLVAAMVPKGYRTPANMLWTPNANIIEATKNLPWAAEAFKGAASFNQVTYTN